MSMVRTFEFAGAPDGTGNGSITQVFSRGKTGVGAKPATWAAFAAPNTLCLEQFTNCTTLCKRGVGAGSLSKQESAASLRAVLNSKNMKAIAKDNRETIWSLSTRRSEARIRCRVHDKAISLPR
jgi:hypothetical protein